MNGLDSRYQEWQRFQGVAELSQYLRHTGVLMALQYVRPDVPAAHPLRAVQDALMTLDKYRVTVKPQCPTQRRTTHVSRSQS